MRTSEVSCREMQSAPPQSIQLSQRYPPTTDQEAKNPGKKEAHKLKKKSSGHRLGVPATPSRTKTGVYRPVSQGFPVAYYGKTDKNGHLCSDILFPYRTPSPPRPDPTRQDGPETDLKRTRNILKIKFLGTIFLGWDVRGPRCRDIPDKKLYASGLFLLIYKGSGRDVAGFGSGRPGFGKTLCKKSLGWFSVPQLSALGALGVSFEEVRCNTPQHAQLRCGTPPPPQEGYLSDTVFRRQSPGAFLGTTKETNPPFWHLLIPHFEANPRWLTVAESGPRWLKVAWSGSKWLSPSPKRSWDYDTGGH